MSIRVGSSRAETSAWISDTALVARSAAGMGFGLEIVVSVGPGQPGTTSELFSYDFHAIHTLGSEVYDDLRSNAPKTGSVLQLVSGLSFGTQDRTGAQVRAGATASEVTLWSSDTMLRTMLAAGTGEGYGPQGMGPRPGIGLGSGVVISINVRTVSWTLPVSYDLPTLSTFAYQNGPVLNSSVHVIQGSGFGQNADYTAQVRFWHTASEFTKWMSESSVRGKTPFGIFKFHGVLVTVSRDVRGSITIAYSYDGIWPYMVTAGNTSGLSPFPCLGNGPASGTKDTAGILVFGHGLNTENPSPKIRVGGTRAPRLGSGIRPAVRRRYWGIYQQPGRMV